MSDKCKRCNPQSVPSEKGHAECTKCPECGDTISWRWIADGEEVEQ